MSTYKGIADLITAANHVVDNWENGDLAEAVNNLEGALVTNGWRGTSNIQCQAVIHHGPGHQSRTKCEEIGAHDIHRAVAPWLLKRKKGRK